MRRIVAKHPKAIRWFHWINFPLITVMMWSGALIYWANDVYRVGFGMAWHFTFLWLFVVNGFCYVMYAIVSGEWRHVVPRRGAFREAIQVTLHDLGLSKVMPPRKKFNGAQQIAYTVIVLMGAGSLLTGLAIWRPVQFAWLTALLGGYQAARLEHFMLTLGYLAFFLVHIVQVIRAGWNNLRSMITGYELEEER